MPYTSITKANFRTDLRNRIGSTVYWVDAELNNAIQEALRTWNLLTGDWCSRKILPTTIGNHWFTLPATVVSSTRLEYRGKSLKQATMFDLDNGRSGWESAANGTPSYWAPVSLNLIAVHPAPDTTDHSITVDGITETPILGSDSDSIDLDPGLYETLLNYARHLLLLKLGGREFAESMEARKALWAYAARDSQRLQASSPYRRIMGIPLDSQKQPLFAGTRKIGVR